MFPLSSVLLPHEALPLHVFEERYRVMVAECLAGDRNFGVVLIERGREVGGGDERSDIGTLARIEAASRTTDGRYGLLARGTNRLRVQTWLDDDPFPRALAEILPASPGVELGDGIWETARLLRSVRALWSELGNGPTLSEDELTLTDDPDEQIWRLCSMTPLGPLDRQRLLTTPDLRDRLTMLDGLLDELRGDYTALLAERSG